MNLLHSSIVVLALAPVAAAQVAPVYVTDSGADSVWRCADLNGDGDYNDAGEVTLFYSDAIGSIVLSNNVGIYSTTDGTVYVSDTTEDQIFTFRDLNGDGDANDAGEYLVFFDGRAGGNASGVLMPSANSLVLDTASGAWFVASANSGTTGNDAILRLFDINNDGDANDAGEAAEYWTHSGMPTGESLPQAVQLGLDGNVYFVDPPSSGPNAKGIYRLIDLNADGDALDANEYAPFFIPPFTATPFYWCLELGADGWFYTADTGNEVVWRFRDLNADGDAQDANESFAWWTVGAASNIWDLAPAADGSVYVTDAQSPQRLFRLFDTNGDGTIGAGEALEIYNDSVSPTVISTGRGIDVARDSASGTQFCFGDGTSTACPCGNSSTPGHNEGCLHSLGTGGTLFTTGAASIANDTLVLIGARMPNSSALYFQGTTMLSGGFGAPFGDGLRCAGGSVIRLGTKFNLSGVSRYPEAGDASVSVRGLDAAGDARIYQVWYRNAASFCTVDTFNLTNAVSLTWAP